MMKKLSIFLVALFAIALTSCFNEEDFTFDERRLVEFNNAVMASPAAGFNFPVITVTRSAGDLAYQVNLVGKQLGAPEELSYSIDTAITAYLRTSSTLIRAEQGVHFELPNNGMFTFKADTSFASVPVRILNPGATTGRFAFFLLKLDGNNGILPSENYRRIGIRVNLN